MNRERSSGVATVMFTDVEGSTDLTTRLGDDAADAVFSEHHRIVRDLIAAHDGRDVESTGDGFLVLFDSTRGALACALAIQRELAAQDGGIRVRIGLNVGEVLEGGELFGAAINLAKRVMDRAEGGQILITDAVRQLVGTVPDARFRDRGRVALKGFPERVRLHEVRPAELRAPPRPARRARRRRWPVPAAVAVVVVAAAATAALLASNGGEAVDVSADSVAIVDPADGRVVADIPVGIRPSTLAVGAGSVWVSNLGDDTLTQIGARSRRVEGTVSPGISVDGLAADQGGVWVADNRRLVARMIDPGFRSVGRAVGLGAKDPRGSILNEVPRPLAVTADALWVVYSFSEIARIDPGTGNVVDRVSVGNGPSGVAVGAGAVWVSDNLDGTLTRIDPRTNEVVTTISVGQSASAVAVAGDDVWVTVPVEDRVKRIDPATNAIADTVRVAGGPASVAIGAGAVWVTSRRGGILTSIDREAARVTRTIRIGHSPQGVAVADGAVWVAVQEGLTRTSEPAGRSDVITSLRPDGLQSGTDPAFAWPDHVQYATCALLLNYPDEPFPAGARLHPEVARAMPDVSDGGRTYTFRLRSGFRFSPPSNEPVTAEAFRRAIERTLHPRTNAYASFYMQDIVGFAAYQARRAKHLAGVQARGDTLIVRLSSPSATLPARLAAKPFCAIPPTTPIAPTGIERIPTAGPYYFATYEPGRRLVLRRNPNYGGDRPARAREIQFDLDTGATAAVAAVENGRADHVNAVPADRVDAIDRRYGPNSSAARAGRQRYFSGAWPGLHFLALNQRRPLFADQRMRQAVNLALDRRALARRLWSPEGAPGRPTDQFVPPVLAGFRDEAIYPLGGPDVEAARRLSTAHGRRAVMYTCSLAPCLEHGRIVRRNLAAIGLDVEVKALSFEQMFSGLRDPDEPWDLGSYGWAMDFADASNFTATLFGPDSETGFGDAIDDGLRRRLVAATRLRDEARARAFAQLDAELARTAVAAPIASAVTTDLFSDRIGCQVHQPLYGVSLGALCVRR